MHGCAYEYVKPSINSLEWNTHVYIYGGEKFFLIMYELKISNLNAILRTCPFRIVDNYLCKRTVFICRY